MNVGRCVAVVCLVLCGKVSANGNLHSIIIELENIKGLVALQEQKRSDNERWVFRYDLLQSRLDTIIRDIEKHISLKQQLPNLRKMEVDVSEPENTRRVPTIPYPRG